MPVRVASSRDLTILFVLEDIYLMEAGHTDHVFVAYGNAMGLELQMLLCSAVIGYRSPIFLYQITIELLF